jgi:hypothetical protein
VEYGVHKLKDNIHLRIIKLQVLYFKVKGNKNPEMLAMITVIGMCYFYSNIKYTLSH